MFSVVTNPEYYRAFQASRQSEIMKHTAKKKKIRLGGNSGMLYFSEERE